MKTRKQIREIAKDAIQEALSKAYYRISDNPDEFDLTEDEVQDVIKTMDDICDALCKRMGRKHYTV